MPASHESGSSSGSVVADQYASRSCAVASTTKSQPWLKPALGARIALLSAVLMTSAGTGRSGSYPRTMRRLRMTSENSTGSLFHGRCAAGAGDRGRSMSVLEPREVGLPELELAGPARGAVAGTGAVDLFLTTAQLYPADLAGDGLGQLGELDATNPLVCREVLARIGEDRLGGLRRGQVAGRKDDVRLWHGEAGCVRRGHHGRLGNRWVLDQHRLELEGTDPVVRGFEHVI